MKIHPTYRKKPKPCMLNRDADRLPARRKQFTKAKTIRSNALIAIMLTKKNAKLNPTHHHDSLSEYCASLRDGASNPMTKANAQVTRSSLEHRARVKVSFVM